jgi:hypothetical protein
MRASREHELFSFHNDIKNQRTLIIAMARRKDTP